MIRFGKTWWVTQCQMSHLTLAPLSYHPSLITGPMDLPILFFKTILFRPYVFVFLAAFLFAVI